MHYYTTIKNVTLQHGDIINGLTVPVVLERHMDYGWAFATMNIPEFEFRDVVGFLDDELDYWVEFLKINSARIWENAGRTNREDLYEHFSRHTGTELTELRDMSDDPNMQYFYEQMFQLKCKFPFVSEEE